MLNWNFLLNDFSENLKSLYKPFFIFHLINNIMFILTSNKYNAAGGPNALWSLVAIIIYILLFKPFIRWYNNYYELNQQKDNSC